jgi:preprotein translocase subunit YajC
VDQTASSLIFLILLIAIFYFMLIRPQRKRMEQHRALVESLNVGDDVVTIGGMHGTVRALRDDEIEIEIASGTVVRFVRSAVARKITEEVEESADSTEG